MDALSGILKRGLSLAGIIESRKEVVKTGVIHMSSCWRCRRWFW